MNLSEYEALYMRMKEEKYFLDKKESYIPDKLIFEGAGALIQIAKSYRRVIDSWYQNEKVSQEDIMEGERLIETMGYKGKK